MPQGAHVIAEDEAMLRSETLSCDVTVILVRPSGSTAAPSAEAANGTAESLQQLQV